MRRRRPSDTENKLLLLHALDRLGAVTETQLLRFLVENDLMDYFAMRLSLGDLREKGLVRALPHEIGELCALSGKGRDTLALFLRRVPPSRQRQVDEAAENWRQRFKRERLMPADFEESPRGGFTVRLRLLEHEETLFDARVAVPTREIAQRFADAWPEHASALYAELMKSLGEPPTE